MVVGIISDSEFAFFNLGRRELSCPKLIQQIQEVRGNVIFGDTTSGNPKQMRFGELDFPIGRSDSQQVSSVSSTPGPSNGNPHVMAVLCPKTSQACPHFPRTNNSDIHITILPEMLSGAVQLCTADVP